MLQRIAIIQPNGTPQAAQSAECSIAQASPLPLQNWLGCDDDGNVLSNISPHPSNLPISFARWTGAGRQDRAWRADPILSEYAPWWTN